MAPPPLSYCADLVRRFDNDRFVTALFAPAAAREALFALYAFNVEVARIREQVREPLLGQMRLTWWRDALLRLYDGAADAGGAPAPIAGQPVLAALAASVDRRRVGFDDFARLIEGRFADMEDRAPADMAALTAYAEATAASLVHLALQALAADGGAARAAGRHVGIAWGLVGLLRAVPHHARAGRIYLPADLNRAAGLDVWSLFAKGPVDGLAAVVAEVAGAAADHLARGRALAAEVPAAAFPALLPARLADGYLARLRQAGFNPFAAGVQRRSGAALPRLALAAARRRW
jgi:phytoene synthase